jgi:uncharacterized hydrophobic protein (TIGR00271 family)
MTGLSEVDIQRMRDQLFFEGPERGRRLSRYWLLLPLAAVTASAGVVSDSTATVIGAMIVAPLMTPILGIVLAVVLADGANLRRCVLLVVAGAAAVVVIGWLLGLFVPYPMVAATNSQVAARVTPRIVDLVAALATGAVGSVALARSDISDTLPGVATAISLVPPLAVVGLTLGSGAPRQSLGAFLLFVTNVAAILASGIVVMAFHRVRLPARPDAAVAEPGLHRTRDRRDDRAAPALEQAWHTHGYYGSVSHNVKAIYQRYLGWYDGNPARLWQHPPQEKAKRYVEFMGGADEVVAKARRYFTDGDLRWAAEVLDHVVFADPGHAEAKALLADVFEQLGHGSENGTWRCEFLSAAMELRTGNFGTPTVTASADIVAHLSPEMLFDPWPSRSTGPRPGTWTWPSAGTSRTTGPRTAPPCTTGSRPTSRTATSRSASRSPSRRRP